jgi:hypothetical protein
MRLLFQAIAITWLSACTSVHVRPVDDARHKLAHVCIQENPAVLIADFLTVVQEGFERHGLSTEIYRAGIAPRQCEYMLTYTARQSWDMARYLSTAELTLWRGSELVSRGDYHLRGKGGFSLMKWQGTKAKIDPVIDQMLKAL